jgi:hypothetical protein
LARQDAIFGQPLIFELDLTQASSLIFESGRLCRLGAQIAWFIQRRRVAVLL